MMVDRTVEARSHFSVGYCCCLCLRGRILADTLSQVKSESHQLLHGVLLVVEPVVVVVTVDGSKSDGGDTSLFKSLEDLQRTMSLTRTVMSPLLALLPQCFLDSFRDRLLGKIEGADLTPLKALKRKLLTALMTACNVFFDSFLGLKGHGWRGCLGNDLNPLEEHEFESSKRQSLSNLGPLSIAQRTLALRYASELERH